MKTCTKCKVKKDFNDFYKFKLRKDGLTIYCKDCHKKKVKNYKEDNKEKLKENSKAYYQENKDLLKQRTKKYREENKDYYTNYMNNYNKERKKNDEIFKFKHNIRCNILSSFKRGKNKFNKNTKTEDILGCTIDEFTNYIQSKFTKGMSLDNQGEWHLDHIIPLATANTEEDVIKLCHYTNFQPLWAYDNLSKGDKIITKQLNLL